MSKESRPTILGQRVNCRIDSISPPRGFTLIELMVAIAVIAILVSLAVPGFNDYIRKSRVKGAAEEIYGLALQAKSEASLRDDNLVINVDTAATPWCVGFSSSSGCDCTNASSCMVNVAGEDVLQVVSGTEYPDVTIAETFAGGTETQFNRIRKTVSKAGTISVSNGDWQLNIVISTRGRIRLCNPNNNHITGYEAC